jgi:hypothetical protein
MRRMSQLCQALGGVYGAVLRPSASAVGSRASRAAAARPFVALGRPLRATLDGHAFAGQQSRGNGGGAGGFSQQQGGFPSSGAYQPLPGAPPAAYYGDAPTMGATSTQPPPTVEWDVRSANSVTIIGRVGTFRFVTTRALVSIGTTRTLSSSPPPRTTHTSPNPSADDVLFPPTIDTSHLPPLTPTSPPLFSFSPPARRELRAKPRAARVCQRELRGQREPRGAREEANRHGRRHGHGAGGRRRGGGALGGVRGVGRRGGAVRVESIQLTRSLTPPGFNHCTVSSEKLVSSLCFQNATCTATTRRGRWWSTSPRGGRSWSRGGSRRGAGQVESSCDPERLKAPGFNPWKPMK